MIFFYEFNGRLGNNLMQYFHCLSLQKETGHTAIILSNNSDIKLIFKIPKKIIYISVKKLYTIIQLILSKKKNLSIKQSERKFSFIGLNYWYDQYDLNHVILFRKKNDISLYLNKYFINCILEKYKINNIKYIAIHIRGTDFKEYGMENFGFDATLPLDYFQKILENLSEKYKVIICTDNTDRIKSSKIFNVADIKNRSQIEDFVILQNANILITSNSTFSITAGILNLKLEKIFIPKYGFGQNAKKYHLLIENEKLIDFFGNKLILVD